MSRALDEKDLRILRHLQKDSSVQNADLSEAVGLSPSPCLRRIRMMEADGVIDKYVAIVNAERVELPMTVFCRVTLDRQNKTGVEDFAKSMASIARVQECYLMAGTYDYLLKVVVKDLEDYQEFQMQYLTPLPGIRNVVSEIPLKICKRTTEYPV